MAGLEYRAALTPFGKDIASVQQISAVPIILDTISTLTGLRFVCVARVTQDRWITCAVKDGLNFGLKVGDELDVKTTLCDEVRAYGLPIVIDNASADPLYCNHHTPRMYGFESYISLPIFRPNGDYFGTLCGLDPLPIKLTDTAMVASLTLFAQLISSQLASESSLAEAREALVDERETAELREQFIAVLGHDLRNPLGSILSGSELLMMRSESLETVNVAQRIKRSAQRIVALVDDVVDLTRGKMGGGISLNLRHERDVSGLLVQVTAELQSAYPAREIVSDIAPDIALFCDRGRLGQVLSNLLKNALVHGDAQQPVIVSAHSTHGLFQLSVTNSGAPISAALVAQLFKPYWRASPSDGHQGLGLGLFIVSEIARSHGGTIDVVCDDMTTSFVFTLKGPDFIERRRALPGERGLAERRKIAVLPQCQTENESVTAPVLP